MENPMIQTMLGKECLISVPGTGTIEGTPVSVQDGWVEVQMKDSRTVLNLDYIAQIREHPRKKNGKKKGLVIG